MIAIILNILTAIFGLFLLMVAACTLPISIWLANAMPYKYKFIGYIFPFTLPFALIGGVWILHSISPCC